MQDFNVMYSKNNHHRHPLKREYFDRPVNYIHKGFLFSPKINLPLDFTDNGQSHYNLNIKMSPTGSSFSKRSRNPSSGGNYSPRLNRTDASLLTTGMRDHEVFN
jgi:hypothetical protein